MMRTDESNRHRENEAPALLKLPPGWEAWKIMSVEGDASGTLLPPSSDYTALLKAPPSASSSDVESSRFVDFVLNHSHPRYRTILIELYYHWQEINEQHFEERLKVPHLTIACGPPQALGFFKSLTDYGGRTQITIDARVVWGGRKFVKNRWPAEGTQLFVRDLLLHESVHQFLAEIEHFNDEKNAKHGEDFSDVCNRIGMSLRLPEVTTRRRTPKDAGKPLTNFWPMNVRPKGYYLGDVIPPREGRPERPLELRGLAGAMSFFRYLVDAGQINKLADIVRREGVLTHEHHCTAKPAAEKGEVSHFNPAWLTWNSGCVGQLVHAICKRKMTDLMPLLADALELAGCGDELLLTHCRLRAKHTAQCWVLKAFRQH